MCVARVCLLCVWLGVCGLVCVWGVSVVVCCVCVVSVCVFCVCGVKCVRVKSNFSMFEESFLNLDFGTEMSRWRLNF